MVLLKVNTNTASARIVAIFGLGLIGSSIYSSLVAKGGKVLYQNKLDWSDECSLAADFDALQEQLVQIARENSNLDLLFIWSAGTSGFASSLEDTQKELKSYLLFLKLIRDIQTRAIYLSHRVVLISSTGGLFEGQGLISPETIPVPKSPYGLLKRQQEIVLIDQNDIDFIIVRVPSIFGYIRVGQRQGLLSTLIINGLKQVTTTITGNLNTLRNYVWIEDFTDSLANLICTGSLFYARRECVFLSSDKPSSIFEIKMKIERVLSKKIYIDFDYSQPNALDITLSSSVKKLPIFETDLTVCLQKMLEDYKSNY